MVVLAGGARLALPLLLLLAVHLLRLCSAATSSAAASNVTAHVRGEQRDMGGGRELRPLYGAEEDIQVGCTELRAKRYISDGFCTSIKPINEVVCAGTCLPIKDLPWYAEFVKVWARSKLQEWQCEEAVVRRKSVHLLCQNGQYRTYRIKVVKSCQCKRVVDQHNRTVPHAGRKQKQKKRGRRRRKQGKRGGGSRKRDREGRARRRRPQAEETEEEEVVDISQRAGGGRGGGNRRKERQKGRDRRKMPANPVPPDTDTDPPGADRNSGRDRASRRLSSER